MARKYKIMNLDKLSSYQNPEGKLQDRLAPRTDLRLSMIVPRWFHKKTVLDIGCNNGYFTRLAMKSGATRAVGVDKSDCIEGARELAKEEGVGAEFWQLDVESKEFQRFCPRFDVVILFSCLTKLKDKEKFLDWLDGRVKFMVIFESNHGEANKAHIELLKKHVYFESVDYLGLSDIPSKPHHMWVCRKPSTEIRYRVFEDAPLKFLPIDEISNWREERILSQKAKYDLNSEKFKALKEDIRKRGIREPLKIQHYKGKYIGFNGIHRYFAAIQLGYKYLPCKVIYGESFKHLRQEDE